MVDEEARAYQILPAKLPKGGVAVCATLTGSARQILSSANKWDEAFGKLDAVRARLPEVVEFWSNLDVLARTDLPLNDCNWLIVSRRMLDTLLSVRTFSHATVPVVMIQHPRWRRLRAGPPWGDYFGPDTDVPPLTNRERLAQKRSRDFVGICFEDLDCVDWEQSEYLPARDFRTGEPVSPPPAGVIRKLVLREPPDGFPPLFRVAHDVLGRVNVSASARIALERAGIRVAYGPIDATGF